MYYDKINIQFAVLLVEMTYCIFCACQSAYLASCYCKPCVYALNVVAFLKTRAFAKTLRRVPLSKDIFIRSAESLPMEVAFLAIFEMMSE